MGNKNSGARPQPPKYQAGDVIIDEKRNFTILGSHREPRRSSNLIKNKLFYSVKCNICGAEFQMEKSNMLSRGDRCPCCSNKRAFAGINDLNTVRPDLIKYLANPQDGELYTEHSNKRIKVKCPDCGFIREINISQLSTYGFSCPQCSDGISYPNKFVRCVLKQLDIKYIPEFNCDWTNKRRYDQYLIDYNTIIENHGIQHYEVKETSIFASANNFDNDIYKRNLAIENGISNYIELDCRYSTRDYIKNSIMNSILPQLLSFDENDIDWTYCDYIATKSLVIECAKLLDAGYQSSEVASMLDIDTTTVNKYANQARKLGVLHKEPNYNQKYRNEFKMQRLNEIIEYKSMYPESNYVDIAKHYHYNQYIIRDLIMEFVNDGLLDYDIDSEINQLWQNSLNNLKRPTKQVYMYTKDLQYIGCYESARDIEVKYDGKYTVAGIQKVCSGQQKTHRGMIFSYTKLIND